MTTQQGDHHTWLVIHMGRIRRRTLCVALVIWTFAGLVTFRLFLDSMCFLPRLNTQSFPRLGPEDNTNVTLVTAFFDLGTFQKGDGDHEFQHSVDMYLRWATTLLYVQNPLMVFTDCPQVADLFRNGFQGRKLKVVFISNRSSLLSFQYLPRIRRVFSDPNYPKFHPNTVVPEYSCSQHAKVDVMEKALAWNEFHTEYFAWVDLGYFRDLSFRKRKFWIAVPPEFDDTKLAACEVGTPSFEKNVEEIFKRNEYWVGGGMFLATRRRYAAFLTEYRRALLHFLGLGLANTDQQVIYSMFQPQFREALNVTTELQAFSWPWEIVFSRCWFYLGYHCYREQ
ncbi:uncharacterized protein LOC143275971 [Babylonia areolata]|uniref:uncharacterized protein LOC143275971 n=1 Tax=Babylonia areolata TaxID=304850 RepID=UPI003FD436A7